MKRSKPPVSKGLLTKTGSNTWTQTERATHEAWGRLTMKSPRAGILCHFLVAHMDAQTNAVVASWKALASLTGMSVATVRRAMADLEKEHWVEGVNLGGGSAKAWVVNCRVAWARRRDDRQYAAFNARVLAIEEEQPDGIENRTPLRRIPVIAPGEQQLPAGAGEDPPSQPCLDGMDPDLPAILRDENGATWDVDPQTGEMQRRIDE